MRFQLPLALLLIPATACVQDSQEAEEVTAALEQENGGETFDDELAMFDQNLEFDAAAIEADGVTTDEFATRDVETQDMDRAANVRARRLIIAWGRMPADRENETRRDWSGELRVSRGALVVRRTIAFEDATDRVLPRDSRDRVRFSSVTRPFADGLALTVLDPTPDDAAPLTLTYTADADGIAHAIDLAELDNGPLSRALDDGNRIVVASKRRAGLNDPCDTGFMRGRWHKIAPNVGVYRGIVANADGEPVGHVRGIFGKRRNGESVMFGKFINREGQFKGVIKGTFDGDNFRARWLVRSGDHGVLHGIAHAGETPRAGHFVARWSEKSCADAE